MVFVIAQLSDLHIGGHYPGSGDRFSEAVAEINAMSRQPDLVLMTGDLTEVGSETQWTEFQARANELSAPWRAIAGNHDRKIAELRGHRSMAVGPMRLILLDTSDDVFTEADGEWLQSDLAESTDHPTVIAMHHPPFETGIWWMDCVGLSGKDRFETIVREHPQVVQILAGHVHRPIHTAWGNCSLWVCPSTSLSVAVDFHQEHGPAVTAEGPAFSLHAYLESSHQPLQVMSHVVPVGTLARRSMIEDGSPEFVSWARTQQAHRTSQFS